MAKMKASEFVRRLKDVATNYKTLYVMGCFGAPLTAANKKRYTNNHEYNKRPARTKLINAASEDTFGFDCVCLLKGVLWGWCGDKTRSYGGASYAVNGVPDIGADSMIKVCSGVSTDFSHVEVGEALWCSGHIGVYIGDGLGVECTPAWKNKVQITAVSNIGAKAGYNARKWTKHGKLPYIEYDVTGTTAPSTGTTGTKSDEETIWTTLMSSIGNAYGVAGLMGNIYAESGLRPNNLQNSYEGKLGYADAEYTELVDHGTYTNFVHDSAGYGLAQWTYWSRKQDLLNFAKSKGKSIGDLGMQLDFLIKELSSSFSGVMSTLKNATSIKEASNAVLTKFERPANMGESVQNQRASYGQKYFEKYGNGASAPTAPSNPAPKPQTVKTDYAQKFDRGKSGRYRVTASSGLHIRAGAGTSKQSLEILKCGTTVQNYGYYSVAKDGTEWLYVQTSSGLVGFCSSEWLQRC